MDCNNDRSGTSRFKVLIRSLTIVPLYALTCNPLCYKAKEKRINENNP